MKVIVVSDVHLGYENSDKKSFNIYLDGLQHDYEFTDLVLLGDLVDMWRRDSSGVFLENHDTFEKVLGLGQKVRAHYVAGNHDFHVLKMKGHSYPLNFIKGLDLTDGDYNYRFLHGYEFDQDQKESHMEALCRVMSDEVESIVSDAWSTMTRDLGDLRSMLVDPLMRERRKQQGGLMLKPEIRLKDRLRGIESHVCSIVRPSEILVFGHTHRPFINKAETVVNCGSWVNDSPIHNTYVELHNGKPRLFAFGGEEILERSEC